ncbi:hypothetical protein CCM_03136 [Cordyceps militaris CM01]|uniref:Uncharacterized protein n=1 Tax=Cordyceps militaris (strain CM01) TaxID=983644 RepID=G3J936_CORMM|nr:uncharacterized protein CCM_03136 [Cordyceps militaris CM01]EGX94865.1 hypothetical protein CCM_03136 [Cordyceps militaris CM01]
MQQPKQQSSFRAYISSYPSNTTSPFITRNASEQIRKYKTFEIFLNLGLPSPLWLSVYHGGIAHVQSLVCDLLRQEASTLAIRPLSLSAKSKPFMPHVLMTSKSNNILPCHPNRNPSNSWCRDAPLLALRFRNTENQYVDRSSLMLIAHKKNKNPFPQASFCAVVERQAHTDRKTE